MKTMTATQFDAINPSTGEVFAKLADAGKEEADAAVLAARAAFDDGRWSNLSLKERGAYLAKVGSLIRQNAKELADLECADVGKTLKQATFIDVPTCAETFEYFAAAFDGLKSEKVKVNDPVESIIAREPVGVVVAIIPWNYPLIMAAWKLAPALLAGNTVIIKPSPLASASVARLGQIMNEAGIPAGVVNVITSSSNEVGAQLVSHPKVDMVSFSGGTQTGKEVMRLAAATTKKITLELGGKSANIVFADSDFEAALGGTMTAIFMNQGQMCTAGSRLLLEDKIYDEFLNKLVEKTKALKIGNAADFQTEFGPVISREQRDKLAAAVEQAKNEGAKVLCGGAIQPTSVELTKGFYFAPTIIEANNSMTIAQEEIFGPILTVIKFSGEAQAIELANDSKYGLAAVVWSKDLENANRVARGLRCGTVWINTYGGFYNEVGFGGYKQSGFGRELGLDGLREFTQSKHICTDQTPGGKSLVTAWF